MFSALMQKANADLHAESCQCTCLEYVSFPAELHMVLQNAQTETKLCAGYVHWLPRCASISSWVCLLTRHRATTCQTVRYFTMTADANLVISDKTTICRQTVLSRQRHEETVREHLHAELAVFKKMQSTQVVLINLYVHSERPDQ